MNSTNKVSVVVTLSRLKLKIKSPIAYFLRKADSLDSHQGLCPLVGSQQRGALMKSRYDDRGMECNEINPRSKER